MFNNKHQLSQFQQRRFYPFYGGSLRKIVAVTELTA